MQKYNEALVQQVREGLLAIENENNHEHTGELLIHIFPKDNAAKHGEKPYEFDAKYFFISPFMNCLWQPDNKTSLPSKPVSDFFLPDTPVKDDVAKKIAEIVADGTQMVSFEIKVPVDSVAEQGAKELIEKFKSVSSDKREHYAKQCALICVDEILKTLNHQNPNFEDNTYWSPIDYWKKVKEQIETL